MKKREKGSSVLDYAIGVLLITIIVLATFLMPQAYSALVDRKDLNKVHAVDREQFSFENPVEIAVSDRVQQMLEALNRKEALRRPLYLKGSEVTDGELLQGIRESMGIAVQYGILPDITGYDIENNIIYAEYYNLSNEGTKGAETGFWNIRFSDYETFDFTFRVDAVNYMIYQTEIYCVEAKEYLNHFGAESRENQANLNREFMEESASYFEAEGYGALTDMAQGEFAFLMGYERGEYGLYHAPCNSSYLEERGIRWGFASMTIALEGGVYTKEWGYKGIRDYYRDMYGVDICGDDNENG